MYIIEKTHDIPIEDLKKILTLVEREYFKVFPNWRSVNYKNIQSVDFSKELTIKTFKNNELENLLPSQFNDLGITLKFGFYNGNVYLPFKKEIKVGLSLGLCREIKKIVDKNMDLKTVGKKLGLKNIDLKISRTRLIDALTHELTHLLDDISNNEILLKKVKSSINNNMSLSKTFSVNDMEKSYWEFNAQIHVIKTLKEIYSKQWDKLNIIQMLSLDNSLKGVYRYFRETKGVDFIKSWLKKLMKRLERENLLGKKMNYIPANDAEIMIEEGSWVTHESLYTYTLKE